MVLEEPGILVVLFAFFNGAAELIIFLVAIGIQQTTGNSFSGLTNQGGRATNESKQARCRLTPHLERECAESGAVGWHVRDIHAAR